MSNQRSNNNLIKLNFIHISYDENNTTTQTVVIQDKPSENLLGSAMGGCVAGFFFSPVLAVFIAACCSTSKMKSTLIVGAGVGGIVMSFIFFGVGAYSYSFESNPIDYLYYECQFNSLYCYSNYFYGVGGIIKSSLLKIFSCRFIHNCRGFSLGMWYGLLLQHLSKREIQSHYISNSPHE